MPGVVDPTQLGREVAATVGEAEFQAAGKAFECARQDQREDRQVGLRGHAYQPLEHVLRHALARHHVPRVHEHRDVFVGAVVEESHEPGIVEVAVADMVADVHPDVARVPGPADLGARGIDVLERRLAERSEAGRIVGAHLRRPVVDEPRPRNGRGHRRVVAEQDRCRGDHLDGHTVLVHRGQAGRRIPQRRSDRPELGVGDHDEAGAVAVVAQPRRVVLAEEGTIGPGDLGKEVRVYVDLHDLPGCTAPQFEHVRASVSA